MFRESFKFLLYNNSAKKSSFPFQNKIVRYCLGQLNEGLIRIAYWRLKSIDNQNRRDLTLLRNCGVKPT